MVSLRKSSVRVPQEALTVETIVALALTAKELLIVVLCPLLESLEVGPRSVARPTGKLGKQRFVVAPEMIDKPRRTLNGELAIRH